MRKEERYKLILKVIDDKGHIDIPEIINLCSISTITARRDLNKLSDEGYLIRTHGGAIKNDSVTSLFSFSKKSDINTENKIAIARYASQFIGDNDSILIDSGTTVFNLCKFINARKNLQVITSSLLVASELIKFSGIKVFLIGGEVIPEEKATYGPIASEHISQYYTKKAFIGTDGISLQKGLTVRNVNEAIRVNAMINSAEKVYVLCDSSKIESISLFKLAPISNIDYIITDDSLSKDIINQYKKSGIEIIVVKGG